MQTRKCGDCNLCCKLPSFDSGMFEKNNIHVFKKDYTWCKHCEIGVGCKIYSQRPSACRDFSCLWKKGMIEEHLKPSKVGFFIVPEREESLRDKIFTIYAETHKVDNVLKKLKDIDLVDADGNVWIYVIRYNNNEDDLALLDKRRYGKKLIFHKRGDYV